MFSIRIVAIFYTLMGALGWALAHYWAEVDPWVWGEREMTLEFDLALGVGVGLVTVITSNLLERFAEWARALSDGFRELLGEMSFAQIFALALFSSFGEEVFFRGFLQQAISEHTLDGTAGQVLGIVISSVVFGFLHIGSDWKTFWPWTVMALVMGAVFGVMFLATGNLAAPIIAHFTINFFNLTVLTMSKEGEEP